MATREWQLRNRGRYKTQQKAWRERNKERCTLNRRRWYAANKERKLEMSRAYNQALPFEKRKDILLRSKYGISYRDFEVIADSQNNLCAICGRPEKLYVDHDHTTGNVRGLLCNDCNIVLGRLYADRASFEEYLRNGLTVVVGIKNQAA